MNLLCLWLVSVGEVSFLCRYLEVMNRFLFYECLQLLYDVTLSEGVPVYVIFVFGVFETDLSLSVCHVSVYVCVYV